MAIGGTGIRGRDDYQEASCPFVCCLVVALCNTSGPSMVGYSDKGPRYVVFFVIGRTTF